LDPPLDTSSRDEPPEAFVIETLYSQPDPDFRRRVSGAILANLKRLALENNQGQFDDRSLAQLASLGFLSAQLGDEAVAHPLYAFALNWVFAHPEVGTISEDALYHLLIAVSSLQNGPAFVPFWLELWKDVRSPRLKAVAIYGLSLADPKKTFELLPEVLAAGDIDLPTVVWNLATEPLGSVELGLAASKLSLREQEQLKEALILAGADRDMVINFENGVKQGSRPSVHGTVIRAESSMELAQVVRRFVFPRNIPTSQEAARRPPYLEHPLY